MVGYKAFTIDWSESEKSSDDNEFMGATGIMRLIMINGHRKLQLLIYRNGSTIN